MWQPNFVLFLNNVFRSKYSLNDYTIFGVSSKANIKLKKGEPLDTQ